MESKKILIICKGFYPENSPRSFRATELALEFARQSHHVTVITHERDYDYTDFVMDGKINLMSFGKLKFKHISYYPSNTMGKLRRKFRRLLFMLFNYPDIEIMWRLGKYLKNVDGYDLLISVAVPYPIHWGVAWARTKNHRIAKTWVADCGDPYFGNTLESFKIPFYFAYIEKWFSRKADFISIPFESLREKFFKEFHSKIHVIPQGFNFDELDICKKTVRNKIPTFAYAGGIAIRGIRSPIKLIEYLYNLDRDFKFHIFCSSGQEIIMPYANKSKGRIIIHNTIPRKELLARLAEMDFLINLFDESSIAVQMPSKMIDYALSGRPILNINPLNPNIEILNEFLSSNYSRAFEVKDISQYHIKKVVQKFLELL